MNSKLKDEKALVSTNVSTVRQVADIFPGSIPALERLFPKVFEEEKRILAEKRIFKAGTKFKNQKDDNIYMLCQVDCDIAKMITISEFDAGNRYSDIKVLYRDYDTGIGFILSEDYNDFEEFTGEVLI